MLFELIVIAAALVLLYVIWSLWWKRTDGDLDPTAPASDIYSDMATNWNPFNLMVDFTEPIKTEGPGGVETARIETFKF